ncbi:unnamed protein product [Rotaria sp. Silwood1]|nr:unnamed protein product [Rotaria sp. Silwood1]CAF1675406.1 unnamed protein product [Rotaria sp. Silwood1]
MSDICSLLKFTFGDVEKYIKDNLDKVCGGAAGSHMKNPMINEKSFALHSEKGHILKTIIKIDDTAADITSNVKHSMAKHNVCRVKINFANLNMSDEDFSSTAGVRSWRAPKPTNMSNMSATEMIWTVHPRNSLSTTSAISSSKITSKGPLCQACLADLRSSPELDLLKQLKLSCDALNLPFSTLIDHAIEQQQPLSIVNTNFGPTFSISPLAIHQHEHMEREVLFLIADCIESIYNKDSTSYPSFSLKPIPSLTELNMSNDNIWWSTNIMVGAADAIMLEANTTGQLYPTKELKPSKRFRDRIYPDLTNKFNSYNDKKFTVPNETVQCLSNTSCLIFQGINVTQLVNPSSDRLVFSTDNACYDYT